MAAPLGDFRPQAVVFDLDGTLVDNLALQGEAFQIFARRHGLAPLSASDRSRFNGKRNSEIFPVLFGRTLETKEWQAFEEEKEADYRNLSRGRLTPARGLLVLLERLEAARIPFAVATSAPRENVSHTLREIALHDRFPIIVRGDQVARGKPWPDVFLEAARRVGVTPESCLAFEDAPAGVNAALTAGMTCVGIASSDLAAFLEESDPPPDLVVSDFDEYLAVAGAWLEATRSAV